MPEAIEFLSKVSIFSLMSEQDLKRIAGSAQHHVFHNGDIIIREGDRDNSLFIVMRGEVEVIKDMGKQCERFIRILGPCSYFGEMALIDDLARSASVVAKGDAEVLSLTQSQLRREIEKYPALAFELLQMLSRRVRAIEKTMINTLGTFLPICSNCKKIRIKGESWVNIDEYIQDHSETEFTYSICPECSEKIYPQFYK